MYSVELYGGVRRVVFAERKSRRAVAREFCIARKTVNKMLRYRSRPDISATDPQAQAGTVAGRRSESSIACAKSMVTPAATTVVKDYLRLAGVQQQEMYVPLSHAPGEAQAGFGEPKCWVVG
jgi:hypothetical protein